MKLNLFRMISIEISFDLVTNMNEYLLNLVMVDTFLWMLIQMYVEYEYRINDYVVD